MLADRTAASTREIAELIASVQAGVESAVEAMEQGATRVDRGVDLSQEAGRMLREIGDSAQQSTLWAKEIVEATRNQTADIGQVGFAMKQVKEIALQLKRGTHEQDTASAEITARFRASMNSIPPCGDLNQATTTDNAKNTGSIR